MVRITMELEIDSPQCLPCISIPFSYIKNKLHILTPFCFKPIDRKNFIIPKQVHVTTTFGKPKIIDWR